MGVKDCRLWSWWSPWWGSSSPSSIPGTWASPVGSDQVVAQLHDLFHCYLDFWIVSYQHNTLIVIINIIIRLGERMPLCGSQKGDVYSFAIILYEIHGRSCKQSTLQIIAWFRALSMCLAHPHASYSALQWNIHLRWHFWLQIFLIKSFDQISQLTHWALFPSHRA